MKWCPISLTIRKLQIKTIMRYHYIPIRMTKIKNTEDTMWLARMQSNRNIYSLLVRMENGITTLDSLAVSYKPKHIVIIHNSETGVLGIFIKELKPVSTQNLHTGVYSICIHNCPNLEVTKIVFRWEMDK